MRRKRILKVIENTIYSLGIIVVLSLTVTALFGSNDYRDPTAMIPMTWRELAFAWLMVGAVPMLLACTAVYVLNGRNNGSYKKRDFVFIFLPGFLCIACVLLSVGEIIRYSLLRS